MRKYSVKICGSTGSKVSSAPSTSMRKRSAYNEDFDVDERNENEVIKIYRGKMEKYQDMEENCLPY